MATPEKTTSDDEVARVTQGVLEKARMAVAVEAGSIATGVAVDPNLDFFSRVCEPEVAFGD